MSRFSLFLQAIFLFSSTVYSQDSKDHLKIGSTYFLKGKYKEAISELTVVINNNPHFKEAYKLRAYSYQKLCAAVHPAGAGMFRVPLSPTGELPATHWASTGLLEAQWAPALEDPPMLYGAAQLGAQAQGLTLTATYADAHLVLIEGDISEEPWPEALARLGLQLCHQEAAELSNS